MHEAVKKLSEINTPISNNILHKVVKIEDARVIVASGYYYPTPKYGIFNLDSVRKAARKELYLRGNPPYKEAAYFQPDGWKLP
jgi:hypothetical protein